VTGTFHIADSANGIGSLESGCGYAHRGQERELLTCRISRAATILVESSGVSDSTATVLLGMLLLKSLL